MKHKFNSNSSKFQLQAVTSLILLDCGERSTDAHLPKYNQNSINIFLEWKHQAGWYFRSVK